MSSRKAVLLSALAALVAVGLAGGCSSGEGAKPGLGKDANAKALEGPGKVPDLRVWPEVEPLPAPGGMPAGGAAPMGTGGTPETGAGTPETGTATPETGATTPETGMGATDTATTGGATGGLEATPPAPEENTGGEQ